MGSKRRTDGCFVKMNNTKARDNAMYRLTDGFNLDTPLKKPKKKELQLEDYLTERLDTQNSTYFKDIAMSTLPGTT